MSNEWVQIRRITVILRFALRFIRCSRATCFSFRRFPRFSMRYSSRRKLLSFECLTESKWKRAHSYAVSQFSILCSSCDRHDDSASGCLLHSRARDKCVELNDEGKLRWGECADFLKDKKGWTGKEERVSPDRPQSDFTPSFTELIESILYVPGLSPQASNMGYRLMSEVSIAFVHFPTITGSLIAPYLSPLSNWSTSFTGPPYLATLANIDRHYL